MVCNFLVQIFFLKVKKFFWLWKQIIWPQTNGSLDFFFLNSPDTPKQPKINNVL